MRVKVLRVVAWAARQIRALREIPRAVGYWLRSRASHCVASVWLGGMAVFGIVTVDRAFAAQVADAPAAVPRRPDGPVEQIAMLDVDEINGIRIRRLHALGLAAAGDRGAPDEHTIEAARAAQARGIELDGEQVATAGKIVVVTRGGIAGWLKRNRGKTADPETLAWLRGEEAAEGRASYAGWADRADGNILSWVRDGRRARVVQDSHPEARSGAVEAAGARPGAAEARGAGSEDAQPATRDAGTAIHARRLSIQGLELSALGGAAASALVPRAAADPRPDQLAALRERIQPLTSTGAVAVSVRDHRVVLVLPCDRLFERAGSALTAQGAQLVRELSRVLAGDRGHAYNIAVDRERVFELVSNLVIGGLPAERVEIALKEVDSAIDVVEVEWIDVKGAP